MARILQTKSSMSKLPILVYIPVGTNLVAKNVCVLCRKVFLIFSNVIITVYI